MGLMSSKIGRDTLRSGDHIYTWRIGYSYSHHGIYVGDGKVIHLTRGPGFIISSSSASQPSNDGVVSCRIEDFLCDGQLHRFKYGVNPVVFLIKRAGTCSLAPSNPPEQVLHRAFYLHKHGFGNYNLLGKNCEDFSIYCKTGILEGYGYLLGRSGQIKSLAAAFFSVTTIPYRRLPFSFIGLAPVVCGLHCFFRLAYDVGFKSQRGGVAVEKLNYLRNKQEKLMEKTSTRRSLSFNRYFGYTSNKQEKMMENTSTRWSLSFNRYLGYTVMATCIYYCFRESTVLKSVLLYLLLDYFFFEHLRLQDVHSGEYKFYATWLLGYWYWRSDSAILLCSRLLCFLSFSRISLKNHPRKVSTLVYYLDQTIRVLLFWYWTPGSRIVLWIKFAWAFIYLFNFVTICVKNSSRYKSYLKRRRRRRVLESFGTRRGLETFSSKFRASPRI